MEKNHLKPWRHREWCIPSVSRDFVAAMEEVLDLYADPSDSAYPTVCLEEKPIVLHTQTRPSVPMQPGRVERRDYEYDRTGTADLFVTVEPLAGWRPVAVTQRRTRLDFADCLRYLVEERSPDVASVRLVVDNLTTQVPAALYEAFPPQRARAILDRLEFH